MKEDKNSKYINYVVDHLVADTERTEFPGIIDPPFTTSVETTSLYTDLAHVQEWKTRQYDSFVEYVKDKYGVIDKELALVWNLYGRRYMNLYDSEEMLNEDIGERSWTSELDRMKWVVEDFDRYIRDLYPFWWMNEVDSKKMFNSLVDMSQETRNRVYAALDKIYFYWDAAMEDFERQNLFYSVDWGDGYDAPGSKQAQNRKKIMIYTKKANPYVGIIMKAINDPDAIKLVR